MSMRYVSLILVALFAALAIYLLLHEHIDLGNKEKNNKRIKDKLTESKGDPNDSSN